MHRAFIALLLAATRKQDRRFSLQLIAWGGLVLTCGGFLFSAPQSWQLVDTPLGLSAAAALVAYIDRRRLADAIVLALPPLAGPWVDAELGAHALLVACLAVYLLTRRPRFAAVAGSAGIALLLTGVCLKQRFAGTPLTWQDVRFFFRQFADNVGVLSTQPTLLWYAGSALALTLLACLVAWRWNPPGRPVGRGSPIAAAALAALLLAHHAGLIAQGVSTLSTSGAWFVADGLRERPLFGFFATTSLGPRWEVPAVDTQLFRDDSLKLVSAGAGPPPADIVVILQESQFNPATIAGCSPRTCRLDAFAAARDTVAHGPLQVHTFGGGTWLSEFALQTGVPHDAFGPAGEFASFSIAPHVRRSFVRSLKAAGYRTVALYPTRGGMMNARVAYAGYGFDEFLDASALGLPESWGTPDALVHEAARRVLALERQHDQPVFLFVETLFNHAEHGIDMDRVPAALLADASSDFPSKDEARSVADYVWRSREFGREIKRTRQAVLGTPRSAVLAWFGDHQPPFANAVTLRGRMRSLPTQTGSVPAKYQTWYEVSSNRPGRIRKELPSALDLVFLPGLLAQAAGAPIDDWLAANVQARTACAGLLEACLTPGVREAYLSYLWGDLKGFELP
ncbi:MAG TPA: sulfatase-like hydrolase/transferase [Ideonella sp.]|nr:sulfatase-like hydrolase/transferase [Ideonella sp.]